MNRFTKVLLAFILSGMGTSAAAFDWPETNLQPYVGLDGQLRDMQYERNNGRNIFAKQFPQLNGYVGLQLNECVAVELGYEYAFKRNRTVRLGPGQFEAGGLPIPDGDFLDTTSYASFQGVHLSLVGKMPVWECPNLKLLGTVGMTYLRANLISKNLADTFGILEGSTSFKKSTLVPRLGVGLEHMFTECFGIRGLVAWEDTSQIEIRASETGIRQDVLAQLKGSFNYSLGVFMKF